MYQRRGKERTSEVKAGVIGERAFAEVYTLLLALDGFTGNRLSQREIWVHGVRRRGDQEFADDEVCQG